MVSMVDDQCAAGKEHVRDRQAVTSPAASAHRHCSTGRAINPKRVLPRFAVEDRFDCRTPLIGPVTG